MKKIYAFLFLLSGSALAQQHIPGNLDAYLPEVIKEHRSHTSDPITINEAKNNSYDGPTKIERYYVDAIDIPHLENVFLYSYTSAGKLTQRIQKNELDQNEYRITYNFNWFGKTESVITEEWNGTNWVFTYRTRYTYTPGQNRETIIYESYVSLNWEVTGIERYTYLGGESTPYRVLAEYSDDGATWTPSLAIDYTYNGNKPASLTISQYNDNYLYFIPVEKWIVSTWGSTAFSADYLFDVDVDQELITDQLVGKLQPYRYNPERFEYWYNFTTTNWTFQNSIVFDGTFANGVRVSQNILQDNMGVLDTVEKQNYYFDPCFGYQGGMYYSKDMLGNWVLGNGTFYDANTVPYGSSCYVTDYDRYTGFNTSNPSGYREYRWVITQAGNLGTEELLSESISVYPNPTNDILNIEVADAQIQSLRIYDLNGALVKSIDHQNDFTQVNVSHLENGIYLIEIGTEKGTEIKRFVKN